MKKLILTAIMFLFGNMAYGMKDKGKEKVEWTPIPTTDDTVKEEYRNTRELSKNFSHKQECLLFFHQCWLGFAALCCFKYCKKEDDYKGF
jgi:hypothetical protein